MSGICIVNKARWRWINVDWHANAENLKPLWTRITLTFSAGWHCWSFGLALRVAPWWQEKRITLGLGPLTLGLIVWPYPGRCEVCGGDPTQPSEDCLAHPLESEP